MLNHLKNSSTIDEPLSFWRDADGFCDVDLQLFDGHRVIQIGELVIARVQRLHRQ